MRKPDQAFYKILLDRYHLHADESLFIDDNLRNVKAAEALGITSIHFQSPGQLREQLKEFQLL
jgi:2-haloacid dehalogenase